MWNKISNFKSKVRFSIILRVKYIFPLQNRVSFYWAFYVQNPKNVLSYRMCLSNLIPTPKMNWLRTCEADTRFELFTAVEILVVLQIMTRVLKPFGAGIYF
jgi:hypothetical protein